MLPFKTLIQLDHDSGMPLYLQIANAIIREISQGRIAPGLRMPGSRSMATILDLNRRTVVAGYDELIAQGCW
ncbi:MAG: GntR family transcriptional regulator [Bacteroidia bacterium]